MKSAILLLTLLVSPTIVAAEGNSFQPPTQWEYSAPLISPQDRTLAQKDPSIVFHEGKWHVFTTTKLADRTAMEYCSFESWDKANESKRTFLDHLTDSKYYAAPQVFYFTPHKKWYLIYQVGMQNLKRMWVAYSTTSDISDPTSWTKAQAILDGGENDGRVEGGLDYWIICDERRAYLFFTNLNGKFWRMWTRLEDFPQGMAHCELALQGPFFEASHTYRLKGLNQYLTIVEENGQRHYKAYVADSLDGKWRAIADTAQHPFAGVANIRPATGIEPWTDNVSHGELVREGVDETMTVDPNNLQFVFQGMLEKDKTGKNYGRFGWRIGMLTLVK